MASAPSARAGLTLWRPRGGFRNLPSSAPKILRRRPCASPAKFASSPTPISASKNYDREVGERHGDLSGRGIAGGGARTAAFVRRADAARNRPRARQIYRGPEPGEKSRGHRPAQSRPAAETPARDRRRNSPEKY